MKHHGPKPYPSPPGVVAMRVAAVLVLLLLAGCSDAPDDVVVVADAPEGGSIRGVVLDTTITPVVAANVTIDGFDVAAVTNPDGAFGFDGLEPGAYILRADATGFVASSAQVTVVAGGVADAKLVMQPEQSVTPFVQPFQWDGFLQCSYRVLITADNCPTGDSEITHGLDAIPAFVQSELVWTASQDLGDALSFQYSYPNTAEDYLEAEGASPLILTADQALIDKEGLGDGLDVYMRVFTSHLPETTPPTGHWGVGLQLDQEFTVFTHAYFHYAPPAGWTFLADGEPPAPA